MYFSQFVEQLFLLMTPEAIGVLVGATVLGVVFGALPGLTATLVVALLSSVTLGLPTELSMVALIGAYVGAIYGPSHSAILLGIPGTSAGAATALDGYPLAMQGYGGQAIATATISSAIGTVVGILAMLLVIPVLVQLALKFTSFEFFLLALFGVMICGSLTSPDMPAKGWIAGVLGLLVSTIGMETIQGFQRFTFDIPELAGGIDVVPVILGGFALPQIIRALRDRQVDHDYAKVTSVRPHWGELRKGWKGIIRSGLIGVGIGSIPGVGEDVAAWTSYDTAKKISKDPESFGKGNIQGVIAAETANNACIGGAIIPVLTLGIPGSPPAAMLLGAMWLHGIRPGPMLSFAFPNFIPHIAATLFLAALVMPVCGLLMARVTVHVLRIPPGILMPLVATFAVLGSFALGLNIFNIYLMFLFGVLVYFLEEMGYPVAPMVIGVILGQMADVSLRRGLLVSDGSLEPFFTRPVALVLVLLIVLSFSLQTKVLRRSMGWLWCKLRRMPRTN
jgi:putative tricarboxylic transport membrane protein